MTRSSLSALTLFLALGGGVADAAQPAERRCDVNLNVTDQDPAGLNVRSAPSGPVVGVLKARNAWVQVHVVGAAGDWLRIDRGRLIGDALPGGEKRVFSSNGFVHVSKLGVETLNPGGVLRATPSEAGRVVFKAPMDDAKIPKVVVLGCDGPFLQIRAGGVVGWTRDYCSNQYTTCA